jgi:hypothetical protein
MKKTQKQKNGSSNSTKSKSEEISLINRLAESNSMTLIEIEAILQDIRVRFFESVDKYELWRLTREMLYLKYAVGLMRKHNLSNLYELSRHGLHSDQEFWFQMGRLYPNGVAVMFEDSYNYTSNTQLIKDFITELSPYLNEAEQMLFKFAICEENFNPETDEDKLY